MSSTRWTRNGRPRLRASARCATAIIAQDRNDPDRYVILAFFDSYESAMENSELPETQAFAQRQASLLEGTPVFHDLDVIDDRS